MSRNQWIKVTDCPYSAEILLKLLQGPAKRSDLNISGNPQTIRIVLDFLESKELIIIEDIRIPRITSRITLTEKGERIAQLFKMIQNCS